MTAGYNLRVAVWRIQNDVDDAIGGASPTGTCLGTCPARLTPVPSSMLLLQQGVETVELWRAELPYKITLRENDELQITQPTRHRYYGKRLLVTSVTDSSMHPTDGRAYQVATVKRVERARSLV